MPGATINGTMGNQGITGNEGSDRGMTKAFLTVNAGLPVAALSSVPVCFMTGHHDMLPDLEH